MKDYDFEEFCTTAKMKVLYARDKVASATKRAVKWGSENPELAITIIGSLAALTNKVWKVGTAMAETRHQNSTIYDHSLGMYWELKHPLTANERIIIERRRKNGEKYGQILSDMRLLKR